MDTGYDEIGTQTDLESNVCFDSAKIAFYLGHCNWTTALLHCYGEFVFRKSSLVFLELFGVWAQSLITNLFSFVLEDCLTDIVGKLKRSDKW